MEITPTTAAIVTGGASGLGAATARRLAAAGARVAIFDLNAEKGEAVAAEIGGLFVPVDVTNPQSVDAGLEQARTAHGVERICVTCAGIVAGKKTVGRDRETGATVAHDLALFQKVIAINLIGTFHVISKSAAAMAALEPVTGDGGRGVIVTTASVAAEEGQMGQAAYAASKGGVAALTLPVARDLSREGIRVASIEPGLFETPMFDALPDDARAALASAVPFPSRLGRPAEYAELVAAIVANDMMNGCTIRLDGAIRLAPK
ncbi:MAG: SDR family NAD(P)-dependent oxidoreductase [Hyphomicrobiaceae bacterium]|nr:SDR family NAD(P)-dependent oxidoreductase [Hyphomicrobiaceae bacterium]